MKVLIPGREIPLWIWLAGYLEFLSRAVLPENPLPLGAPTLLAALAIIYFSFRARRHTWNSEAQEIAVEMRHSLAGAAGFALLTLMFLLALWSATRPPFLPQEYDAINYQMGVPHQLLLRHSLAWIPWSVADLWPMAIQWGMAPLWFAFSTINKIPQWIFALGVAACLFRLARQLHPGASPMALALPALAILGAHGVATQLGTGMMDLPILYLPLLTLSCLLDQRYFPAALGLAVFAASKAFHPFLVAASVGSGLLWLRFAGPGISRRLLRQFLLPLGIFSVLLLARSSVVSLTATGTPLFPFGACHFTQGEFCSPENRPALSRTSDSLLATRNNYGNGRGLPAFALHLWRVAIPTTGVNNEFDYPLGLPWLLFLVLLTFSLFRGGMRRPILGLAALFWMLWWLNAHQSRWLYPTLAFGWLGTIPEQLRARRALPVLLLVSTLFSFISQVRSLYPTTALSREDIRLREEAKVKWSAPGTLDSVELLYVNEPAKGHTPGNELWVLR